MRYKEVYKEILESLAEPIVFADTEHVIVYMNKAAVEQYKDRGGAGLVGSSLLDCHNENSCSIIKEIFEKMKQGLDEQMISDDSKKRVFMRAVRDEKEELLGYYERYEYK